MRPSLIRRGEMPGPRRAYNYWWGAFHNGVRQKDVIQYTMSPWQSKAAPQMFRTYLFNFFRRARGEALYVLIPFGTGYAIYSWGRSYNEWLDSKAGHLAGAGGEH